MVRSLSVTASAIVASSAGDGWAPSSANLRDTRMLAAISSVRLRPSSVIIINLVLVLRRLIGRLKGTSSPKNNHSEKKVSIAMLRTGCLQTTVRYDCCNKEM